MMQTLNVSNCKRQLILQVVRLNLTQSVHTRLSPMIVYDILASSFLQFIGLQQ